MRTVACGLRGGPSRFLASAGLFAAAAATALLLAEAVLRIAGFSFSIAPSSVVFGWPRPVSIEERYVADPDLFWHPRDYDATLARAAQPPPSIVFLGDSCTEFGIYPGLFVERLRRRYPGRAIRGVALGASAWSSYQGLAQLRRDVLPLSPRIVTFYFGWNDHWLGFGIEDADVPRMSGLGLGALRDLRISQLVFKAWLAGKARMRAAKPLRVPPAAFRANLVEMARLTRAAGAVPVLLTAPTSHEPGREPEYLAERYVADLREVVPLHQRYVSIVREAAQEQGAVLCDLAAGFQALPREELRTRLFMSDGIHLEPAGDAKIAELLDACFRDSPELSAEIGRLPEGS
jgi:lysophospholipase L1-like esterase